MKQFKCSMRKKIERLGKKQESISGKLLLDPEKFEKAIRDVIDGEKEDILKDVDDDERMYYEMAFETLGDSDYDYAGELCKRLQDDMLKYVSGNDYRIMGNFNNIEWDWENAHKDGIKFRDLRKKLLDGVNDADTDEFSTWAIDWFFDTFGTYNMCYKYRDTISDLAYSYQREDEENGDADESKKSEATKFIDSKIDALVKEISDKYGFTLKEKTKSDLETSWYLVSGNTFGHMADGKIAIWINGFGAFLTLGYKVSKGYSSSFGKDIRTFDTLKKNLLADCDKYFDAGASESKKSESVGDFLDAKIDYNMFMRMCKTAAYLEEDEDYWDALWDFYSEVGNIGDALVFFDNLFQYTAWKDVDETYDELDESDQDGSKSKEECIEAVLDRDGEIRGSLVQNYGDYYLWVY